jgi:hypothetical protein
VRSAQVAFFGDALERIDPNLPEKFVDFDNLSWKLLYQLPECLARDTLSKRADLLDAFRKFYNLPQAERTGSTAWVNNATEDILRAEDIPTEDVASIILILYWG